ncbi:MAG: hypothetical protein N2445_00415 [Acidobacteria bacterium]|nr:hypothetical protein [Acidobacteriota bacterium]
MEKNTEYIVRESILSDKTTPIILQKQVGIRSAAELAQSKIATQFFRTSFFTGENKLISNAEPFLTLEIDSLGKFSYLKYSPKESTSPKDVSKIIQKLFLVLELNPETLAQVAQEDLKNEELEEIKISDDEEKFSGEKKTYRQILYKQKIEGVPLASYIHKFSIGEKEVVYKRDIALKKSFIGEPTSPVREIVKALLWFIVAFFSIAVLIVKIRRDEIDWVLFIKVMVISALLSFMIIFFKEPFSLFLAFMILIVSFLIGLFFALIFALAESKTREVYPEKLTVFDALFQGHFRIKELGKTIYWCFIYGNLFFLIQIILAVFPNIKKGINVALSPPNPLELKTFFPLSLLSQLLGK